MANNISNATLFSLFWENSKINSRTVLKLAKNLEEDARATKNIPQLFYPTEDLILTKPKDKIARLMTKRRSVRTFTEVPLSERQLGSLFHVFAQKGPTSRLLPSAGGKYPIEVFAFLLRVKGKFNKKIVYYNPDTHSLSVIADSPSWGKVSESFGLELKGKPAIVFIFAAIPERTIDKYGERGGRFILLETGHYAQNLALRVASEKLGGVISGALHDDAMKQLLGLEHTNALITLGYACGCVSG